MASELEFVNYSQFVENLPVASNYASGDKSVVSSEINGPRQMTQIVADAILAQSTLADKLAHAFDPTRTSENPYIAGKDVCVYNGGFYIFTSPHFGAWNADDALKISFEDFIKKLNGYPLLVPTTRNNAYIDVSGGVGSEIDVNAYLPSQLGYRFMIYPCKAGDLFIVTGVGGNSARLWTFLNASKVIISQSSVDCRLNEGVVVAPDDASYILIQDISSSVSYFLSIDSIKLKIADCEKLVWGDICNANLFKIENKQLMSNNAWVSTTRKSAYFYKVEAGDVVTVVANANYQSYFALLKSINFDYPDFMTGFSSRLTTDAPNDSKVVTCPEDGFLYIFRYASSGADYSPLTVRIKHAQNPVPMVQAGRVWVEQKSKSLAELISISQKVGECTVLEKNLVEKMAHKNTPIFRHGVFFDVYVCDDSQTVENASIYSTHAIRMSARFEDDMANGVTYDVFKNGVDYDGVVLSGHSPRSANLFEAPDGKHLFVTACVMHNGVPKMAMRSFDLDTMNFENGLTLLQLDGQLFTADLVASIFSGITGLSVGSDYVAMNGSGHSVKHSNGYTYWGVGGCRYGCHGLIVRSADLINWESVTAVDVGIGTSALCWELALLENAAGDILCAFRGEGTSQANAVFKGVYDVDGDLWGNITKVDGTRGVRPFLFKLGSVMYLLANADESFNVDGYGTVTRGILNIYRTDDSFDLTFVKSVRRNEGINYAEAEQNYDGDLFIFYSNDRKRLNVNVMASQIRIEKLNLVD